MPVEADGAITGGADFGERRTVFRGVGRWLDFGGVNVTGGVGIAPSSGFGNVELASTEGTLLTKDVGRRRSWSATPSATPDMSNAAMSNQAKRCCGGFGCTETRCPCIKRSTVTSAKVTDGSFTGQVLSSIRFMASPRSSETKPTSGCFSRGTSVFSPLLRNTQRPEQFPRSITRETSKARRRRVVRD